MGRQRSLLILILILVISAVFVIVTKPTRLGLDLRGGSQITIQVKTTDEVKEISERELEAVRKVMEERVNGLGVSEAVVQTSGRDQILVQLPGVNDPKQAERVLGGTAQLDFRLENREKQAFVSVRQQELQELLIKQQELQGKNDEKALADLEAQIKAKEKQLDDLAKDQFNKSPLNGKYLRDAMARPAGQVGNNWLVELKFNEQGGKLFADLTKQAAANGLRLGIFLDDKLISAPGVDAKFKDTGITGGEAVIEGNFTFESARDLELQLRGGSLPVPIQLVENRTVGATLGRDSVERSIYASIGGLGFVLIFLAIYYLLPGAIADVALIIYALLSWASFVLFNVTMTLPGVAGFILSIGMAVDANVLIFERTREELRAGKSLYRSVEAGFYRAFAAILDGNVTVAIACAALFVLGSGLVKGFAVTLALGVAISFFTAVTCTRTLMMTAISSPQLRQSKYFVRSLPATPQDPTDVPRRLNVNKTRRIWWALSATAIVAGLIAMGISWQQLGSPLRPSLEFVGGTRLQFELDCSQPQNCNRPVTIEAVRDVLNERGLGGSSIQVIGNEQRAFSVRTRDLGTEERDSLQQALSQKLGTFDAKKTQITTVGPTIGSQLLSSGLLALLVSFAGIVIYISVRYQLDFAVFAIIALMHNVLITLGIFSILGLTLGVEVDSLFIVALLTITGFSVNDTVVIYDRIRELQELEPNKPFSEIVDDAVNQTLTRSLNIAFIVLLTLFALLLFGGETLRYFALAQIVGFATGLYTSIFIASTLLSWWRERTGSAVPAAEGADMRDLPAKPDDA